MRFQLFRPDAVLAAALFALLGAWIASPVQAQQAYHNIVNQHFRTVGNGPQSALIIDVNDPKDAKAVGQAVTDAYSASFKARTPAIQRELAFMRQRGALKPGRQLDLVDVAILRYNGKLLLPQAQRTRAAGNDLTFNIPTSGTGAWSIAKAGQLTTLTDALKAELKAVYGDPAWSGTVDVLNQDPKLGTVDEILGALIYFNTTTNRFTIQFPSFTDPQTEFLAMAQVMAQAFHGPDLIGYDAWEKGMARAVAIVAARDLRNYNGTALDPANGFYYTPNYDILNQPALANNTFTPPTKGSQPGPTVRPTQFGGMLVPRLEMSGTAWLKCYIENPGFFRNFNAALYAGIASNSNNANDVNALRGYARAAQATVEGQPFDAWFEQQFVLDTSVTPGNKLYAYTTPLFPDGTASDPNGGAAVYLIYYQTTPTGDELDLNGIAQVVYWDYSFQNRLFLPSFETVSITNGFGSVAPFFTGLGGTPPDKMRIAMDFPVNKEYVRVYFPTGQTGDSTTPNDFLGVVVGQDSGSVQAQFDSGGTLANVIAPVVQGEFGANSGGSIKEGFSRTTLTLSQAGTPTITYKRNVYIRPGEVAPLFQLVAPGPTTMLTHTFLSGPQMISLPILPLTSDLARVIGADPTKALMAQYRQDLTSNDKYLRYPSLPRYQPGYGLWTDFAADVTNPTGIIGISQDIQKDISVGLEFGWNQIGPPYNARLNVANDLQFQYLGGTPATLAEAIGNGWVAAGIIGWDPSLGYEDITSPTDVATFPTNQLEPWKGYWIRVIVGEGVTLTYSNPNNRSARKPGRAASAPVAEVGAWRMPLYLRDATGNGTAATLGQSPKGADTFQPAFDVASPPSLTRAPMLSVRFPHPDWDTGQGGVGGDFMSDIRRSGTRSQWEAVITLPQGEQDYALAWGNMANLPRGTRLTLTDTTTGARQLMNSSSRYAFRAAKGETTRKFVIVAEPRSAGRLAIHNISAVAPLPTPGRAASAMTISYELTASAETTMEIRLAGRIVRHLAAPGRAAQSGVNQMVWDLKDDQGRNLPAGTYLLQVTARTPEGEQTRSVVPVTFTR